MDLSSAVLMYLVFFVACAGILLSGMMARGNNIERGILFMVGVPILCGVFALAGWTTGMTSLSNIALLGIENYGLFCLAAVTCVPFVRAVSGLVKGRNNPAQG